MDEKILVLDFGGQYDLLIARRIRENHVYAEIRPYDSISPEELREYRGVIFTGGPASVYAHDAPRCDRVLLQLDIPILGICYGAQLMAWLEGGTVALSEAYSEYGKTTVYLQDSPLFRHIPETAICWMSHTDQIITAPPHFQIIAHTDKCPCAALSDPARRLYGVQFHPEVTHTDFGQQLIRNFLFEICGCDGQWRMEDFVDSSIRHYQEHLKGKRVLCALSGGVDSSVAAVLLHRAIGDQLTCIFVDHGLLRKDEGDLLERLFRDSFHMSLIRVNAASRFLSKLSGITAPEEKRRIIGQEFIRVFEAEAKKLGRIEILAQGTIYPDVVESGHGSASTIKSHHNVGGLPEVMDFEEIVEPLRELFKDEVRQIGLRLGIPHQLIYRQPFPGPGLAVRIAGAVTKEKLDMLREADRIFCEEVEKGSIRPSQYFAVLTDLRSVGVKGDAGTYGRTVILRAVTSDDFMTAEWTRLSCDVLERASLRITGEVPGVTRVVYDVTSKPPATVEWE